VCRVWRTNNGYAERLVRGAPYAHRSCMTSLDIDLIPRSINAKGQPLLPNRSGPCSGDGTFTRRETAIIRRRCRNRVTRCHNSAGLPWIPFRRIYAITTECFPGDSVTNSCPSIPNPRTQATNFESLRKLAIRKVARLLFNRAIPTGKGIQLQSTNLQRSARPLRHESSSSLDILTLDPAPSSIGCDLLRPLRSGHLFLPLDI
jgi:hypothetical protein